MKPIYAVLQGAAVIRMDEDKEALIKYYNGFSEEDKGKLTLCEQKGDGAFGWLPIKTILLCLIVCLFGTLCFSHLDKCEAGEVSHFSNEQIVNAIYKAENSKKFPYGIKSIDTKGNAEYARKICFNSVKNGRARWIKAGKPDDLITFISRRYCPINAPDDPTGLNRNWISNVKFYLRTEEWAF